MEVATASHYDGATALAEALLMASASPANRGWPCRPSVHPFHRRVIKPISIRPATRSSNCPTGPTAGPIWPRLDSIEDLAAVAVQSPNFFGCIEDLQTAADATHAKEALFVASFTEPLAFGLLKNPGSLGADIVCGEGQSLGLPRSFGGPGLGMLGSRMKFVRSLPGRLVGRTLDRDGRDGFVLTLSTREQHIRREKATSNICTNNSLCALTAAVYMAALGATGFRELAQLNRDKAEYLKNSLAQAGFDTPFSSPTFNEFVVRFPGDFDTVYRRLLDKKIVAGLPLAKYYPELSDCTLLCATETAGKHDLDNLVKEVRS